MVTATSTAETSSSTAKSVYKYSKLNKAFYEYFAGNAIMVLSFTIFFTTGKRQFGLIFRNLRSMHARPIFFVPSIC